MTVQRGRTVKYLFLVAVLPTVALLPPYAPPQGHQRRLLKAHLPVPLTDTRQAYVLLPTAVERLLPLGRVLPRPFLRPVVVPLALKCLTAVQSPRVSLPAKKLRP